MYTLNTAFKESLEVNSQITYPLTSILGTELTSHLATALVIKDIIFNVSLLTFNIALMLLED